MLLNKTIKTDLARALLLAYVFVFDYGMTLVSNNKNERIEVRTFAGKRGRVKLIIPIQ